MDDRENRAYWEGNAEEWTRLARAGYDRSRDLVNSPAFFAMLPDVRGRRGLDVGCGEGHNTRMLADRGAVMTALDVARGMIEPAQAEEARNRRGIVYVRGSALSLPFNDGAFSFATAFMSLMDMPEHRRALDEVRRVLEPGGFFQLSMTHPCFQTPMWQWLLDDDGNRRAVVCGDYFRELTGEVEEWGFTRARQDGLAATAFASRASRRRSRRGSTCSPTPASCSSVFASPPSTTRRWRSIRACMTTASSPTS